METKRIELKKSSLKANSEFDYHQIQQKHEHLLDCQIERNEDIIIFDFMLGNTKAFSSINQLSKSDQYIFLINVYQLQKLYEKIDFQMNPENIYIDINMMPMILMRDVYLNEQPDEMRFVLAYKALIGTVFQKKYSFDDYFKGGEKILRNSRFTSPFAELSSSEDIYHKLIEEYEQYKEKEARTKIHVEKSKYRNLVYFRRIGTVVVMALLITCVYFGFFAIPENNAVIQANETFIKQDYIATIESLKDIQIGRLSSNSKYIYAVSYIKTDALSNDQKNNILSSVTIDSNTKILDYWINLSKNDYDEAIDLSKQLDNKEYQLYGYMKQKSYVEKDGSLTGQERETKIKEIEAAIKELTDNDTKKLNEADDQETSKEG